MSELEKPSKFVISPYPSHEEQERMHIFISKTDTDFIRCLRPRPGTLTAVGAYLWHAFCVRCRELGITDFTQTQEFERLIQNIVVVSKADYEQLCATSATAELERIPREHSSSVHAKLDDASNPNNPRLAGRTPIRDVSNADGPDAGAGPKSVRPAHPGRKTKRANVQGVGQQAQGGQGGETGGAV